MARGHRFVTLDGMRGVAALVVATAHVGELFRLNLFAHADLAVDFFFVLSGFVIAQAYEQRLAGSMTALEFLKVRIIRLYPIMLLGSGIAAAIMLVNNLAGRGPQLGAIFWAAIAAVFLIPAHALPSLGAFPLDGPVWSLFAEIWVNVLFAFIAASLTTRRLNTLICAGLVMLMILFGFRGGLDNLWRLDQIGLSILRVVYPFFVGVLLSRLHRSGSVRVPRMPPMLSVTLLGVILLAPAMRFDAVFQFATVVAVFPLLVLASTGDQMGPTATRLMLFGGALSYPIYLLHYPVAELVVPVAGPFVPAAWNKEALAVCMICVLASSYVALRYLDEPVRAWLGLRMGSRKAGPLIA